MRIGYRWTICALLFVATKTITLVKQLTSIEPEMSMTSAAVCS
jgi:hypothetical protein